MGAKGVYIPTSLTTPSLLASQVFFWVAGLGSAILIALYWERTVWCSSDGICVLGSERCAEVGS